MNTLAVSSKRALDCAKKRWFPVRQHALRHCRLLRARGGPQLFAYRCPCCAGWHVTSQRSADQRPAYRDNEKGWRP